MRFVVFIAVLFLSWAGSAQTLPSAPPAATTPAKPRADPLGRDSPRGCATGFLKTAGQGDYTRAAQYLNTPAVPIQAEELARQLKVVLDLGLSGSIETLPRTSDGDLTGGLPPDRQRFGVIKLKTGALDLILERVQEGTGSPVWLFSADTLSHVPDAFGKIEAGDLTRYFPKPLTRVTLFSIPLWRWFAIPFGLFIAVLTAFFLTKALMPLVASW